MKAASLVLALAVAVGMTACRQQRDPNDGEPIVNPGPLPDYAAVAEAYNQRLANLERLSTYTSVRFWITDDEGKEHTEVLDARLQVVLPSKFFLRLDKVSTTYAVLGCNDERYWWIELGDKPRALWGAHAAVNPEHIAEIAGVGGLPVHPLDMIELLGITPLPAAAGGIGVGDQPSMSWSPDGKSILVIASGTGGRRRLWLDPKTLGASRIELLGGEDEHGPKVLAASDLSDYVAIEGVGAGRESLIASKIVLQLPEARAELRIQGPREIDNRRISDKSFDLDWLTRNYSVRDVRCLDEAPPAPAPDQ